MKHPQFKNGPFLYRPSGDRIRFVETSEKEILDIYTHVHDKTDYVYDIKESQLSVKDYLDFLAKPEVIRGAEDVYKRQGGNLSAKILRGQRKGIHRQRQYKIG